MENKRLPEWGEMVICKVTRITPYAAWVDLIEYPGVEGMIHVSEVAGKWVHDIRDFVKPNKQYVAKVVKVDYQKNSINLSIKRVSKRDEKEKLNSFKKEQRALNILEQAANQLNKSFEQAYNEVGYLIEDNYGSLFDAFKNASKEPDILLKAGVPEKWNKVLLDIISKSFIEKEIRIKAELEIRSFESDGVKKIKKILNNLEKTAGASVKYISAPKYLVELKTKNPKMDEKKLIDALNSTVEEVEKEKGEGKYELVR